MKKQALRDVLLLPVIIALLGTTAGPAKSQPAPFDMTPERPAEPPAAPSFRWPQAGHPTASPPFSVPTAPTPPATEPRAKPNNPSAQTRPEIGTRRYIIPSKSLVMEGEEDRRVWSIYLSEQQAKAKAKFHLGFQNAVVIAPEISQISVLINGQLVGDASVAFPDAPGSRVFDIPSTLLQPGSNRIEIRSVQRHRTDCSIDSTYELWTDIDPAETFLSFDSLPDARPSLADAIRAIGPDENGNTDFEVLMPAVGQAAAGETLVRLSQGLSLLSGMPNQNFKIERSQLGAPAPGRIGIVIGTASELQPIFGDLPAGSQTAPVATLATDPRTEGQVLLITGPDWRGVAAAVDSIVSPLAPPRDIRRDAISTQRWSAPDAPLLFGGERLSLSELGVDNVEFAGRRIRANFNIGVPADFYANAYGEATLLLDAAFAESVLPGSHFDVYVNGNIASTMPITSQKGGILRHMPIRVTLRHFKPGVNNIALEAVVLTESDKVCQPGATSLKEPRIAVFGTSEWAMPTFARIGQIPNLAGLAGTGFPYGRGTEPLLLASARLDADTLAATSTFMARLALSAGRLIPIEILASQSTIGERNVLFFGALSDMPDKFFAQLKIDPNSVAAWRSVGDLTVNGVNSPVSFDEWRSRVRGGAWSGQISALQEWLRRNFDITLSSLQFAPGKEPAFAPTLNQSLVIAQGSSPQGAAIWTAVTAPTVEELSKGVKAITMREQWSKVSGRIAAYEVKSGELTSVSANDVKFVRTMSESSLNNYRLVIANWLSTNVLTYAVLLVVLATVLGLATAAMLGSLGRRDR
ncbi:cellulose synthase subunit [Rhizobium sp. NFR07]|uniref:cellulose biosynthesis cyclic di-GMP-binding regulatory protein BcsB n=1 Tax=Rhizobium sp. NFR07 TaxID=1566262 RepID=UPI0008E4F357|nr:cellulose biosynthesis cyclic di-GMP-binding regulatory protein BcsB [Rhizobium sp. NFR07]SFB61068.1 cellulose synthase subunit [Rhizobium sp. NFR07]